MQGVGFIIQGVGFMSRWFFRSEKADWNRRFLVRDTRIT
jgi:hypothetical protein